MKYLAIAQAVAPTVSLPPEQVAGLYEASIEWIQARIDEGTVDCVYTFPDAGGVTIANADSHEAIYEMLISYPMYGLFHWEIKPLCDWKQVQTAAVNRLRGTR